MGEALIAGLLNSSTCAPENITVSDINTKRLEYLDKNYGISATTSNLKAAEAADIFVLAVKPQKMPDVLKEISDSINEDMLIITIAAGVKISTIEAALKNNVKVVRVMPNMCAQVGESVSAICHNRMVTESDKELVMELFGSVGESLLVDETLLDAVTGISGSGPAYIFLVMETLIQAGVQEGLTFKQSREIVLQMVKGSAELAIKTGEHPAQLKERIMSPGGTTVEGLKVLEKKGFRGALLDAVSAAVSRSKELG